MTHIQLRLRAASDRGAAMFLIIVTILIVVLAGAFAVDLSATSNRGQELQSAADASALAGVQAYRASINLRATVLDPDPVANSTDQAAAVDAINAILQQNGITGLTPVVTFPDGLADTEVQVELVDPSGQGKLLSGFTGGEGSVSRVSTAAFRSCADNCARTVPIPSPFSTVNAKGEGDGYKPISVGENFYAINHNNTQITCVNRLTQTACWCRDTSTGGPCLTTTQESDKSATRYAYSTSGKRNPEMPHTAVYNTTIWWTSSDSTGTHLFCWETTSETACSNKYTLTSDPRASSSQISSSKDRNRGGGTVIVDDLIYAFTDNHQVHCFNPLTLAACDAPVNSALGADHFPANDPNDDNHGASIDRIVDNNDKIYSTIHIKTQVPIPGPYDCSQNLEYPLGKRVVVRVASNPVSTSDRWVSGDTTDPNSSSLVVRTSTDGEDLKDRWDITDAGDGYFNVANGVTGHFWDADKPGDDLEMSTSASFDDQWLFTDWDPTTRTFEIQNRDESTWIQQDGSSFRTVNGQSNATRFSVNHWQCEVSPAPPQPSGTAVPALPYAAGTWLHCYDTVTATPCSSFTPSRIHQDASRFSGRLFFNRDSSGIPNGVCSSGYDQSIDDDQIEIKCVDLFGILDTNMSNPMLSQFEAAIANSVPNQGNPAAWGDPHWNELENRLFYPTQHSASSSQVLCWDFDFSNGWCGSFVGTSPLGQTEDYGFYSEGDCVYALGHRSRFYAFKASSTGADLGDACTGSETEAKIHPCACSGEHEWGTISFDIDLSPYQAFDIIIENSAGTVIWPKNYYVGDPGHSLFSDGLTIPLSGEPVDPVNPALDFLLVKVHVENIDGLVVDPNAGGVDQSFEIQWEQTPILIK